MGVWAHSISQIEEISFLRASIAGRTHLSLIFMPVMFCDLFDYPALRLHGVRLWVGCLHCVVHEHVNIRTLSIGSVPPCMCCSKLASAGPLGFKFMFIHMILVLARVELMIEACHWKL